MLLIAAMGERLTEAERVIFKQLTGLDREPGQRVEELIAVIGRRGGKSRAIAVLAVYLSGCCKHPLDPGETGILLTMAQDTKVAKGILRYARATFENSPILSQLVSNITADTIELTNSVNVEVRAASFRNLRGPTYIAIIADEIAFWRNQEDSANPDTEIIAAAEPGLTTTRGPMIIISSPYAKRGVLWQRYSDHYAKTDDPLILVAQAASKTMNATLSQRFIDRKMAQDAAKATAEYLAQFRSDLEAFVAREVVKANVSEEVYERAYQPGVKYFGFVDPSGGSSDSFTLAITHRDRTGLFVLDVIREQRPPLSPSATVAAFSRLLKDYHITKIQGDRYAGQWPVEAFRKHGIIYEQSAAPKSDLYQALLPVLNSGRADLLDHRKLVDQLCSLERRTARGGRDSIDHPPKQHDDVANAVAGAIALAAAKRSLKISDTMMALSKMPASQAIAAARSKARVDASPTNSVSSFDTQAISMSDHVERIRRFRPHRWLPTTPGDVGSASFSDHHQERAA